MYTQRQFSTSISHVSIALFDFRVGCHSGVSRDNRVYPELVNALIEQSWSVVENVIHSKGWSHNGDVVISCTALFINKVVHSGCWPVVKYCSVSMILSL